MKTFVLDSSAWLEYFFGTEKGKKVETLTASSDVDVTTPNIVVAEVISKLKRENFEIEKSFPIIISRSRVIHAGTELSEEAGLLHAEKRKEAPNFSLSDAFIWVLAKKIGATIVTKDVHFKDYKPVVLLK